MFFKKNQLFVCFISVSIESSHQQSIALQFTLFHHRDFWLHLRHMTLDSIHSLKLNFLFHDNPMLYTSSFI